MTLDLVARIRICHALASSAAASTPVVGQSVASVTLPVSGTLLRVWTPRGAVGHTRALVATANGNVWCNLQALAVVETDSERAARISAAAASMLNRWDHRATPGSEQTWGEVYAAQHGAEQK